MKIRTGDTVVIISGKDKGKQGRVLRVLSARNRLVVEGINMKIRHIRKTASQAGQRISFEGSMHASNVMVLDAKTGKPTRITYKIDQKTGKKSRVAQKSGEVITGAAKTKAAPSKDGPKKQEKQSAKKAAETPAPAKQPFWKRGGKEEASGDAAPSAKTPADTKAQPSAHRSQGG